jgi:pimeloyl-ACP methyl ester carboxylesterase
MLPVHFDQVQGKRVRFSRLGNGPPLVLLHGYPDNLQLWSEVAPLLARELDVIAPDWPGMGGSDAWQGGATPFHMATHLAALLDHWRVDRTAVVGLDMGGQPALVFAARHPHRVSHLVVCNSLVQWDAPTSWEIAWLRRFRFNQLVLRHCPRLVFRRALSSFLPRDVRLPADTRVDFWEHFRRRDVRNFIVRMCAGYQATLPMLPDEYRKITAPTLVLWGTSDRHFPPEHGRRLQQQITGSTLQAIDGGEHWLPLHRAVEFATAVRNFVRSDHPTVTAFRAPSS